MKLSSVLTIMTALLFISASMMQVNATDTVPAVPTLISIQMQEIRGSLVSYEEGLLRVIVDEEEVTIHVNHLGLIEAVDQVTEESYGAQFAKLQAETLIDMMVTKGLDTSYQLESVIAIHQKFDGEPVGEHIMTAGINETFRDGFKVTYKNSIIEFDVKPQVVDDHVMVPLRAIAEALGYEVIWNNETRSVDLIQGPHFTSVFIGNNAYFINRMAPSELSVAPLIINGRTLIPIEFITEILGYGVEHKDNELIIYDEPLATLTGYISAIEALDSYKMVYIAPRLGDDVEMWEQTVLIVSDETINNKGALTVGEMIHGVHLPMMTMSIPGQTSAVILY